MRTIKFRVWTGSIMEYDITTGKFGTFYVNPGKKGDGLDEKDSASLTPFNTKYSEQTPVMQFTGLLDKNGKEIYEGDIVRTEHQAMGIMIYIDDEAAYKFDTKEPMWSHPIYGMGGEKEVIGNIYSNPELISKP